jgi:hypothetical protein
MAESETAEIAALKQEVIRLKQIVITMKYDIDNIDGDVMSLEDRITILETDYTPQQQVRRLTQGEVEVMDRALRRSTRLVHAGELAPASTAEQPAPPAVVDYTSVTAGGIVGCWEDKWEIDASNVPEGACDDLEVEVRRALSAVHSKYQATIASLRREIDEAKAALDAAAQLPSPGSRNE